MPRKIQSRRHADHALRSLEPRQLRAADLMLDAMWVESGATEPALPDQLLTIKYTISNRGNSSASAFSIAIVQSDTSAPTGLEEIITGFRFTGGLGSQGTYTGSFQVTPWRSSLDFDDNVGHIAVMVDSRNEVVESNESNNSGRGVGIDSVAFRLDGHVVRNPASNSLPSATLISAGNSVINGTIGDELIGARDIDAYAVDCVGGRWYEADIDTNSFGGPDTAVRIYDASFSLVASNDDGGYAPRGVDPYVQWAAPWSGRYYVVVSAKQNANADPRTTANRVDAATGSYAMVVRQLLTPTVTVRVNGGTVTEGATSATTLTVTRQFGNNDRDLFVKWETYGSAGIADFVGLPADGITIPAGQASVTISIAPANDGISEPLEYLIVNLLPDQKYVRDAVSSSAAIYVDDNPATHVPTVIDSTYVVDGAGGTFYRIAFDQDVTGFDPADVTIYNATGGYNLGGWTLNRVDARTYLIDFRTTFSKTPPDGRYMFTLRASAVSNSAGRTNTEHAKPFTQLAGDVTRDGVVNFDDLLVIASNYNTAGKTFSQGNVSYDAQGTVNFDDLLVLASKYNQSLPPLAASATIAAFSSTPIERDDVLG
jgi:hypothetical protein